VLSDEEFAAEKRRILDGPDSGPPQEFAEPEFPSRVQQDPWWKNKRRMIALVGGALALSLLFSILVSLDIMGRNSDRSTQKADAAKAPKEDGPDVATGELTFEKPGECRPGGALRQVVEKLGALAPSQEAERPIEFPGLKERVTPRVETVSASGSSEGVAAQLAVSAPWKGLTVTHVRTVRWPNGTSSFQLRFAEGPADTHKALKAAGFSLNKVGEVQNIASDGRQIVVGIEEVPEGTALTCVTKA
jgi:hypothetical protein